MMTLAQKAEQARYDASPARKAARARYEASPEGKARRVRYTASPEGKARRVRYQVSSKGKVAQVCADVRYRYGIDQATYDAMLIAQSGLCAICSVSMHVPYIDHNHTTNTVRALLCNNCNVAIGFLNDSHVRAYALGDYLIQHGNR